MITRLALLVLLLGSSFFLHAKEIDVQDLLYGKWGNKTGFLRNDIRDFDHAIVAKNSTILVTWDGESTPENYLATRSFFEAFSKQYPNAEFATSIEKASGYDYLLVLDASVGVDSFEYESSTYRDEPTGFDCKQRLAKIHCEESGVKRVESGSRTRTGLTLKFSVKAILIANGEAVRISRIFAVLSDSDNCNNTDNVTSVLAYLLGSETFTDAPDSHDFRFYPNQLGCYLRKDILPTR